MTTKQIIRLNMYLAVVDFISNNEALTKDLPNFSSRFEAFLKTIEQIRSASVTQGDIRTGVTSDKNKVRDKLVTLAADTSRKMVAFAKFSGNLVLLDEIRFSTTRLGRMRETDLKSYTQIIHDKTEPYAGDLESYGITPETQSIFQKTINDYYNLIGTPRLAKIEKSVATQELVVLFGTALSLIEDMDTAVEIIRLKEPDFYTGYRIIRKLVHTSAGKLALKVRVCDLLTGEPVKGVKCKFIPQNVKPGKKHVQEEFVKKTAGKGRINIKHMHPGTYQVVINKPGYKEAVSTVSIAEGERGELRMEIEKGAG